MQSFFRALQAGEDPAIDAALAGAPLWAPVEVIGGVSRALALACSGAVRL
jgi:hypothetical protein